MHAFTEMTTAHPIASAWIALTIWTWILVYAHTGGAWRRKAKRRPVKSDPA
ncbi:hypothetical protein [Methylocystis sp. S23]|jgi:hypothetical protein